MKHLFGPLIALLAFGLLPVATQAETAATPKTDRIAPSLAAANAQRDQAWRAAPMGFTAALFIDGVSSAYGHYTPRARAMFKRGDLLKVYAEPVGFGFGFSGGGFTVAFDTDVELLIPSGQIIGAKKDFAGISQTAAAPVMEFRAVLTYRFGELKPGKYILQSTFRDRNSDKRAVFALPFEIVE